MNLTNQRRWIRIVLTAAACLAMTTSAWAQGRHYPAGVEGLRAASLPPPGVYARDYNFFYFTSDPDLAPVEEVFAYINAPRVIWMTKWQLLGAQYGMDVIVPFGYQKVKVTGASDDRFDLGDIQIEPLLLSWHVNQFDLAVGYAIWAPTGDFDPPPGRFANIGMGYWTHMLTAGATWNIDTNRTWTISMLNRYEINHEQEDTDVTPGQMFTMELGIGKSLTKQVEAGLVGYWQQETTETTGMDELSHVLAGGAEINAFCPKLGLSTSIRYLREFEAKNRTEGNTVVLTLTRRF